MMQPSVLETSERAVAWLPRGLMKTAPGDVSLGQQVPGHQKCTERGSWQRGAGSEHGPGSVTTSGPWAWPPSSWTSAPDERPGECFSLPTCGGPPTPRAPHRAREPHGSGCLSMCRCSHSAAPSSVTPAPTVGVASRLQHPSSRRQRTAHLNRIRCVHVPGLWNPHPPNSANVHTRPRNQNKGREKAAAAATEEPPPNPGYLTSGKGRLQAVEPFLCHALPQAQQSLQVLRRGWEW